MKRARVAEAEVKANADVREAENRQRARLKEIFSQRDIIQAEADRRVNNAKSRAKAMVAEAEGQVKSEIARTEAAIRAAEATVEQTRRRLEADVIAPAAANMEAGIADAKGNAAQILEDGRATVTVLQEMICSLERRWAQCPRHLPDAENGQSDGVIGLHYRCRESRPHDHAAQNRWPRQHLHQGCALIEELKAAVGVDIPQLIQQVAQGKPESTSTPNA